MIKRLACASVFVLALGCGDGENAAGSASAAASTAAPKPTTPPPTSAPPKETAAPLPDRTDCPPDSKGPGTQDKPCEAAGATQRMMEVKWTNKLDDNGPEFNVKNLAPKVVLYGKLAVYFYDKDGKQLDTPSKKKFVTCSGDIFGGVMKLKESARLTFSCVKKADVPEGATAIEGEMIAVGFADSTEKKNDYYWGNKALAPDERPKGGVVAKK